MLEDFSFQKFAKAPKFGRILIGTVGVLGVMMLLNKKETFEADCSVCARPYAINDLGLQLIERYGIDSNGGAIGWKSFDNPEGVPRTIINIAGSELFMYGDDGLEHYMATGRQTNIFPAVLSLLRTATVPKIMAGDVINFIEFTGIGEREEEGYKMSKEDQERWSAETFNEEHEEHDEIDDLIQDLDNLTGFCISFLHDGAHGGETMGRNDMGEGLEEERVRYVEGSIELKFIYEDGENTMIRASYPNDPNGPVIYLPPTKEITTKPHDERKH